MMAYAHRWRAKLAMTEQSVYPMHVPEKEGTRGGSLKTVKRTSRASGFVFCACLRASLWSGDGVGAFGLAGFALLYQSSNPPFAAPPVWKRGCGVTTTARRRTMPNHSRTSVPLASLAQKLNNDLQPGNAAARNCAFGASDHSSIDSSLGRVTMDKNKLRHRVSLAHDSGSVSVLCSVENFVPSGGTVLELLAHVWQELLSAASKAALISADRESRSSPVSVGMDMDDINPWLTFCNTKPREFLSNQEECFERLRSIAARFLATNRPLDS